jgi:hypothetical protein
MGFEVEDLRDNAERCRRLARIVEDERNQRLLLEAAVRFDDLANKLEQQEAPEKRDTATLLGLIPPRCTDN